MKNKIIQSVLLLYVMTSQGAIAATGNQNTGQLNSYCPKISQIKKNQVTQTWRAQTVDGTWKSYQTSFASDLTKFLGAQWNGESVGQVTCVYKAEQRYTEEGNVTLQPALPVMLVFHTLAQQPTGPRWKKVQMGIRNCYADHQKNCPFKINIKKKAGNIYQEAESLKSNDADQLQPVDY